MNIVQEITISFLIPEEYDEWQNFLTRTDIKEWRETLTTGTVAYKSTRYFSVGDNGVVENIKGSDND